MAKRKQPNGDGGMKRNPYSTYPGGYKGTYISQIRPGYRPGDEYYGDLDDYNTRDSDGLYLTPRGAKKPQLPTSADIKEAIGGNNIEQKLSRSIGKKRRGTY